MMDSDSPQPSGSTRHTAIRLSDPQYTARWKRMLEFLTRVCALACVPLSKLLATTHQSRSQSCRSSRPSFHRRNGLAETAQRGELLTRRGSFWHQTPARQRDLHPVSPSGPSHTNCLIVKNIDVRRGINSHTLVVHGHVRIRCS